MTDGDEMVAYLQSNAFHSPAAPRHRRAHWLTFLGNLTAGAMLAALLAVLYFWPALAHVALTGR